MAYFLRKIFDLDYTVIFASSQVVDCGCFLVMYQAIIKGVFKKLDSDQNVSKLF